MSIKFVSGNIFTYQGLDAICHGCNCKGLMGAGIAADIRRNFPKMHQVYKQLCTTKGFTLGDVFIAQKESPAMPYSEEICSSGYKAVYNLATQDQPGPNADLAAIRTSVRLMIEDAETRWVKTIGVPRLGAGIGGLRWEDVKEILIEAGNNTDVELIVFEEFVK